jgi:hypothetical protein
MSAAEIRQSAKKPGAGGDCSLPGSGQNGVNKLNLEPAQMALDVIRKLLADGLVAGGADTDRH